MSNKIITRNGLSKIWNNSTGEQYKITHIGLGVGKYNPSSTQESLLQEIGRWPIIDAEQVSLTQLYIHATIGDDISDASLLSDNESYEVNEIGYYLSDGTLFAVSSVGENGNPKAIKTKGSPLEVDFNLSFESTPLPDEQVIIQHTGIRYNPGMKEAIEASENALDGYQSSLVSVFTAASVNTLDSLKSHKKRMDSDAKVKSIDLEIDELWGGINALKISLGNDFSGRLSKLEVKLLDIDAVSASAEAISMVTADQDEYMAEVLRGMGQSGIYLTRQYNYGGQKAYQRPFGVNYSALGIHSHWDFNGLCGMAEGSSIVDGRYIRRRHTDYHLNMPAPSGSGFLEVAPIDYPDVPSDVAALPPDDQAAKMREYFEVANGLRGIDSVANYRDAFKLCISYEEQWEEEFNPDLADTFFSGRHVIDAKSIQELLNKVQYFNAGGHKNRLENISYFHSLVSRTDSNGNLRLSIRKSRVVVMPIGSLQDHPINDSVELVDDIITRKRLELSVEELEQHRGARFRVKARLGDDSYHANAPEIIDEWMGKIPGLDGDGAEIREEYNQYGLSDRLTEYGSTTALNAANYNRFYSLQNNDASNRQNARRGYNDPTLFVAKNTRAEVTPVVAGNEEQRFSRITPLELIVLTPLHKWNPYAIPDLTDSHNWRDYYRNDYGKTEDNPVPGYFNAGGVFYHTPGAFYKDSSVPDFDPADTALPGKWIMCGDGISRKHTPSGVPIFLPEIEGVGRMRIRYPIPFMYHEGSHSHAVSAAQYEELDARIKALE